MKRLSTQPCPRRSGSRACAEINFQASARWREDSTQSRASDTRRRDTSAGRNTGRWYVLEGLSIRPYRAPCLLRRRRHVCVRAATPSRRRARRRRGGGVGAAASLRCDNYGREAAAVLARGLRRAQIYLAKSEASPPICEPSKRRKDASRSAEIPDTPERTPGERNSSPA